MGIEKWHEIIRAQEGEVKESTYWATPLKHVKGNPDLKVGLVSAKKGNSHGLEEGVYARTNADSLFFRSRPYLYNILAEYLAQELERVSMTLLSSKVSQEGAVVFNIVPKELSDGDELAPGYSFSKN